MSFLGYLTARLEDFKDQPFNRRLTEGERITRYLRADQIYQKTGDVKPNGFSPPKTGDLSVMRTEGASETRIWEICRKHVESSDHKKDARGDFPAGAVKSTGLRIDPNGIPIKRHADILGWRTAPEEFSWNQQRKLELSTAAGKAIWKPRLPSQSSP